MSPYLFAVKLCSCYVPMFGRQKEAKGAPLCSVRRWGGLHGRGRTPRPAGAAGRTCPDSGTCLRLGNGARMAVRCVPRTSANALRPPNSSKCGTAAARTRRARCVGDVGLSICPNLELAERPHRCPNHPSYVGPLHDDDRTHAICPDAAKSRRGRTSRLCYIGTLHLGVGTRPICPNSAKARHPRPNRRRYVARPRPSTGARRICPIPAKACRSSPNRPYYINPPRLAARVPAICPIPAELRAGAATAAPAALARA